MKPNDRTIFQVPIFHSLVTLANLLIDIGEILRHVLVFVPTSEDV